MPATFSHYIPLIGCRIKKATMGPNMTTVGDRQMATTLCVIIYLGDKPPTASGLQTGRKLPKAYCWRAPSLVGVNQEPTDDRHGRRVSELASSEHTIRIVHQTVLGTMLLTSWRSLLVTAGYDHRQDAEGQLALRCEVLLGSHMECFRGINERGCWPGLAVSFIVLEVSMMGLASSSPSFVSKIEPRSLNLLDPGENVCLPPKTAWHVEREDRMDNGSCPGFSGPWQAEKIGAMP